MWTHSKMVAKTIFEGAQLRGRTVMASSSPAAATWCSSSWWRAPTRWRPRRPWRRRRGARHCGGARQPVGGHGVRGAGDVVLVVVVARANPLAATASVTAVVGVVVSRAEPAAAASTVATVALLLLQLRCAQQAAKTSAAADVAAVAVAGCGGGKRGRLKDGVGGARYGK